MANSNDLARLDRWKLAQDPTELRDRRARQRCTRANVMKHNLTRAIEHLQRLIVVLQDELQSLQSDI
jgi:hypothetical protein